MRIGIVPILGGGGGVYQYSVTVLQALKPARKGNDEDDLLVFCRESDGPAAASLVRNGWNVCPLIPPSFRSRTADRIQRVIGNGFHRRMLRSIRLRLRSAGAPPAIDQIRSQPRVRQWLLDHRVDLMFYLSSDPLSFETGLPFVMTIHDLQHRLQPEFPEVSAGGVWQRREYDFRNAIARATLLLADSEVGREDILRCYGEYGATADRIRVLPYLPACYLPSEVPDSDRRRVRERYRLPPRYLFYPAQFWPHKNHRRIVQALSLLKRQPGLSIPIVFCGSHTGEIRAQTFADVKQLVRDLQLTAEVCHLGYVPDEDMAALYAEAIALVMPTFFGPTNIPVLEAWAFGCPVLTSDIRGIREQAGPAARLVDPRSVEAIADGMRQLWTRPDLRQHLAAQGKIRLAAYTPDDFRRRLTAILEEAKGRVQAAATT